MVYPLDFKTSGVYRVRKFFEEADKSLETAYRQTFYKASPQSAEIANSTQFGHLVSAGPKALYVHTDFGKEGPDRTADEIRAMQDHLKKHGLKLAKMPG